MRIINNFKLMVLRAQTELGALLWICFTPKYMLSIFVRKKNWDFFFRRKIFRFFFSPKIFSQKNLNFFPVKKKWAKKKSEKKISKKIKSTDIGVKHIQRWAPNSFWALRTSRLKKTFFCTKKKLRNRSLRSPLRHSHVNSLGNA